MTLRFGLIARSEDRGIGIQTWEIARNMRPDRVLVVDMDGSNAGFAQHFDRFSALGLPTTILPAAEMANPRSVAPWCSGLDVILTVETFYRWAFCDIARAEGARTVVHLNPEFYKHRAADVDEPEPDAWWAPSPWLRDHPVMPPTRFMPMPVPFDRWTAEERYSPTPDVPTIVHVAGHPAALDRNGTKIFLTALRHVTEPCHAVVVTQRSNAHRPSRLGPGVRSFRNVIGGVPDYWRVPLLGEIIVIPRRYGGLCLPALEAAGAGRALVMSDVDPNWYYPAALAAGEITGHMPTGLGDMPIFSADPKALADEIDCVLGDGRLDERRADANAWAYDHSWDRLHDAWIAGLHDVARG